MPRLSVIVPVYNTEEFLEECLESIFSQGISDLEVIAIDDESPDNSIAILQAYAEKHENLTIIRQKNAGISATRNNGIKRATGNYICWIDSDDYYCKGALAVALEIAENNDLDFLNCSLEQFPVKAEKQPACDDEQSEVMTGAELLKYAADKTYLLSWPSMYLYKRSFLAENNISFEEGMTFECSPFHLEVSLAAKRAMYVNTPLYRYRVRTNSLSHSKTTPAQAHNVLRSFLAIFDILDNADISKDLVKCFAERACLRFTFSAIKYGELSQSERAEFLGMCSSRELMFFYSMVQSVEYRNRRIKTLETERAKQTSENEKLHKEIERLKAKNAKLKTEIKESKSVAQRLKKVESSQAYKIGRAITAPARILKKSSR